MSNTSTASDTARPARRSTRLNAAVPLTVMGVDSYRGPYREDVSTVTVSLHGCKYESKHDVLTNSWVVLEFNGADNGRRLASIRGLVKWVKRPQDATGVYETAIELEEPGNVWGIDSPPEDWVAFCESRLQQTSADLPKSKPFALPKPEVTARALSAEKSGHATGGAARESKSVAPVSTERPVGELVGEFHRQMERMLFEAAGAAVRERATSTLEEVRHELEEEAKRILTVVASSQTGLWIDQSVKQLNKASQESARGLHAAWARRIDADIQKAIERIEERGREFETLAQSLSANALDRLQRALEASRTEGVDRIVSRLKEQSAPLIDRAKETVSDLAKRRQELDQVLEQSLARSSARIEEFCERSEERFKSIIEQSLDSAREQLEQALRSATGLALENFSASTEKEQAEARTRLRDALKPVTESALGDLKREAADTSRQFTIELKNYSKSHLELVGGAISDLAKGLGKLPKE